jgi:hypothetical protein
MSASGPFLVLFSAVFYGLSGLLLLAVVCSVQHDCSMPDESLMLGERTLADIKAALERLIDDACLVIAHQDATTKRIVVDLVVKQSGSVPFSPRAAIKQFCDILQSYRINKVYGDAFAGQTFRHDFEEHQVQYEMRSASASDLYERLEPPINAGEVELPDHPTLVEQIVSLVWRGNKITHEPGSHDDHANALGASREHAARGGDGDDRRVAAAVPF